MKFKVPVVHFPSFLSSISASMVYLVVNIPFVTYNSITEVRETNYPFFQIFQWLGNFKRTRWTDGLSRTFAFVTIAALPFLQQHLIFYVVQRIRVIRATNFPHLLSSWNWKCQAMDCRKRLLSVV